jgi:hypothetical protein
LRRVSWFIFQKTSEADSSIQVGRELNNVHQSEKEQAGGAVASSEKSDEIPPVYLLQLPTVTSEGEAIQMYETLDGGVTRTPVGPPFETEEVYRQRLLQRKPRDI